MKKILLLIAILTLPAFIVGQDINKTLEDRISALVQKVESGHKESH